MKSETFSEVDHLIEELGCRKWNVHFVAVACNTQFVGWCAQNANPVVHRRKPSDHGARAPEQPAVRLYSARRTNGLYNAYRRSIIHNRILPPAALADDAGCPTELVLHPARVEFRGSGTEQLGLAAGSPPAPFGRTRSAPCAGMPYRHCVPFWRSSQRR